MQRIPFDLLLIREKSFIFTNYYKSRGPDRTAVSMSPDSSIEILSSKGTLYPYQSDIIPLQQQNVEDYFALRIVLIILDLFRLLPYSIFSS